MFQRHPIAVPLFFVPMVALSTLAYFAGCREHPGSSAEERNSSASADSKAPDTPRSKSAATGKTVRLVIDYGDGAEKRFAGIAWREEMTVLDVLEAAKGNPHGITFSIRGSGEQALLTKLDDLENQKGAAGAKNWIFYVNDRMADKSLGATIVNSGDTILWKFERFVQ
ncbi:MAG TPA: DUF4430 domain-containing protein [Pirellulales bacterium]|nr:DUF4430 domain-containing protein [Pirellulales bacterium]